VEKPDLNHVFITFVLSHVIFFNSDAAVTRSWFLSILVVNCDKMQWLLQCIVMHYIRQFSSNVLLFAICFVKCQQAARSKEVTDYRFFVRSLIRHSDLVTKEASFDYLENESERTVLEAMDALEIASSTFAVSR